MTNICSNKHNFVTTKLLSRQAYFCHDKHVFVATKHIFCHDKSMLLHTFVATKVLSLQIFVATNIILTRQAHLSWQTRFCRDKTHLLSQQKYACRDKKKLSRQTQILVATKVWSWQKYSVATKLRLSVATKVLLRQAYWGCDKTRLLSRQKLYFWQLPPMIQLSISRNSGHALRFGTDIGKLTGWVFSVLLTRLQKYSYPTQNQFIIILFMSYLKT